MYAAVVSAFDAPPRFERMDTPVPEGEHEVVAQVLAAGLHPRVRSQADGSHYTSTHDLPLVPGIDGVGRLRDGRQVYFILPDTTMGSMAEQTLVDLRRSITVPEDADPVVLAAAMNPAMSSWVALRRRIEFHAGQSVLVMGATGNAGRMAIQIAKHLGASRVVGAGRDKQILETLGDLGADTTVSLDGEPDAVARRLGEAAGEVDVVIDYLWGKPAEDALMPLLLAREDRGRALTWLQIGSIAGPTMTLPSVALRSANLQILGSGQGSVTTDGFLVELPALAAELVRHTFTVDALVTPLSEIEQTWSAPSMSGRRVVVTP